MKGRALHGLFVPCALLAAWEITARAGALPEFVLPAPSAVALELVDMMKTGQLWLHLGASVVRVLVGFALGAVVGAVLGFGVGLDPRGEALLDPTVQALRSVPSLAWVPLLLLWMGIGEAPKITLIAIGSFFPVYLNAIAGVRSTDRKLIELGHIHGLPRLGIVRAVILPSSLPSLLTGLRTGLAVAWLYVVAAELMAAHAGLGFLLTDGRELSRADLIFVAIVLLAGCGKISDGILVRIERRLLRWREEGGG
ncbi:ABC transporter permease [Pendulispora albinea]|uniref:ABC transporter permease n=1 Tax=Pendulispora albinea TaxID=2741071 RepID=A0ABZ2LTY0_9BACT